MPDTSRTFLLGPLLKGVSRSFYLTMRILPVGMRDPIGLAYLLARAADTIADTSLIVPAERLSALLALRAQVNGTSNDMAPLQNMAAMMAAQQTHSDEKTLLESLAPAITLLGELDDADRQAVRDIVSTLSDGMEFDLLTFPDESSGRIGVLPTMDALDRYTYLVAGCVGEFWTKMTYLHAPGTLKVAAEVMEDRGIRFGKALQMTNVLRDCGKDLRIGRCYLPEVLLERFALRPEALLLPGASLTAKPLLDVLVPETLAHFKAALDYTLAIPGSAIRLRLASLWPIIIGLETLLLLVQNDQWLDPERGSKFARKHVYQMIAKSLVQVPFDGLVRAWVMGLMGKVERQLAA